MQELKLELIKEDATPTADYSTALTVYSLSINFGVSLEQRHAQRPHRLTHFTRASVGTSHLTCYLNSNRYDSKLTTSV